MSKGIAWLLVVLISAAAIVNLATTVITSNKLLEEISTVRTDLFTLKSRIASLDSIVNDVRNRIEKSEEMVKSIHFARSSVSLEKTVLKASFTLTEFTEVSQVFLVSMRPQRSALANWNLRTGSSPPKLNSRPEESTMARLGLKKTGKRD